MLADLVLLVAELVLDLVGVFSLIRAVRSWRGISAATTPAAVWPAFLPVMLWSVSATVTLGLGGLVGAVNGSVLLAALLLPALTLFVGLFVAVMRARRLAARRLPQVAEAPGDPREVVIHELVPGRVRGLGEDGKPVRFSKDNDDEAAGARGQVRLLSVAAALAACGNEATNPPVLGFWDGEGSSLLLYHDDKVSLATEAT